VIESHMRSDLALSIAPTASLRRPASGNRVLGESFKRVPTYSYY
jgi:hypothetical protein